MKKKPATPFRLLVLALFMAACNQVAPPVAPEESLETLGQINSKHAIVFDLSCEDIGTLTVATNGQSFGVPFDIVGTNDVFIIATFSYVITDSSGTVVEEDTISTGQGKKRGLQNELITCTETGTFTRDGSTLTFFSTYRGFIVPKGK